MGSKKRAWLRWIVAVVAPVALLAVAELSLRATGLRYPTSAVLEVSTPEGRVGRRNIRFGWRFFPKTISRASEPFSFEIPKPPGTYRIFVLGGSAAQGTPDPAYAFSRILDVMLAERYPGARFEVVNIAITAVNSHVVREVARDCARYEPDLFVVYLGNNEVLGPFGAGTVFGGLSSSRAVIRAGIALRSWAVGQMLERGIDALRPHEQAPLSWQGLAMFLDKKVRPDSRDLALVYGHFRDNLEDVVRSGLDAGAAVVVSTVAVNLRDCPPFSSEHRPGLAAADLARWNALYDEGVALERAGRCDEALGPYTEAAAIDGEFADLRFRTGRCREETGAWEQAQDEYRQALERDTLRFRADARINDEIREVAREFADRPVRLADAAGAIGARAPHGLPGDGFFYEHVHLRFAGNWVVAHEVLAAVEPLLPAEIAGRRGPDPVPDETDCAARLAFTGWDRLRILASIGESFVKRPPSTGQLYYDRRVADWSREMESLAAYRQPEGIEESAAEYREALRLRPDDWKLHAGYGTLLLSGARDAAGAAEQWRTVLDEMPDYDAWAMLGTALGIEGDYDEAIAAFEQALRINPLFDQGYANLGMTLMRKGDAGGAADNYLRAVTINPQLSARVYVDLARALTAAERPDEAIARLRQGVESYPDDAELRFAFGALLAEHGDKSAAIEQLRRARMLAPDHPGIRPLLRKLGAH